MVSEPECTETWKPNNFPTQRGVAVRPRLTHLMCYIFSRVAFRSSLSAQLRRTTWPNLSSTTSPTVATRRSGQPDHFVLSTEFVRLLLPSPGHTGRSTTGADRRHWCITNDRTPASLPRLAAGCWSAGSSHHHRQRSPQALRHLAVSVWPFECIAVVATTASTTRSTTRSTTSNWAHCASSSGGISGSVKWRDIQYLISKNMTDLCWKGRRVRSHNTRPAPLRQRCQRWLRRRRRTIYSKHSIGHAPPTKMTWTWTQTSNIRLPLRSQ